MTKDEGTVRAEATQLQMSPRRGDAATDESCRLTFKLQFHTIAESQGLGRLKSPRRGDAATGDAWLWTKDQSAPRRRGYRWTQWLNDQM